MKSNLKAAHPPASRGEGAGWCGRLKAHLAQPLQRNTYALILTTVSTGLLGLVYWGLAARFYSTSELGRGSAAISALLLLGGIAQLNLGATLPRFLPDAGTGGRRLVLGGYGLAAVAATLLGTGFVIWARATDWAGGFLAGAWTVPALFVVAVLAWCLFTLQDAVLIGLRQAVWVPVENMVFGITKLVLLVTFASMSARYGLFASWVVPVAGLLIPVNWLIFTRLIPLHSSRNLHTGRSFSPVRVRGYLGADYVAGIFQLAAINLLPLIVTSQAGLEANGYFFSAWIVANAFEQILLNMGTSLTVEGATSPASLAAHTRSIVRMAQMLVLPALLLVVVAAGPILSMVGEAYADRGTALLRLVAVGLAFRVVTIIFISVARVRQKASQVALVQGCLLLGVVAGSAFAIGPLGIVGVGVAYLATNAAVALGVVPALRRLSEAG